MHFRISSTVSAKSSAKSLGSCVATLSMISFTLHVAVSCEKSGYLKMIEVLLSATKNSNVVDKDHSRCKSYAHLDTLRSQFLLSTLDTV